MWTAIQSKHSGPTFFFSWQLTYTRFYLRALLVESTCRRTPRAPSSSHILGPMERHELLYTSLLFFFFNRSGEIGRLMSRTAIPHINIPLFPRDRTSDTSVLRSHDKTMSTPHVPSRQSRHLIWLLTKKVGKNGFPRETIRASTVQFRSLAHGSLGTKAPPPPHALHPWNPLSVYNKNCALKRVQGPSRRHPFTSLSSGFVVAK